MARRPLSEVTKFMVKFYNYKQEHDNLNAYKLTEVWWMNQHGERRYTSYESFRVCLHHFLSKHKQRITNN